MKSLLVVFGALFALVSSAPALAQDESGDDEDLETVTRGRHAPLVLPDDWINPADSVTSRADMDALPFDPEAYRGAEQLGLNPEYVQDVRTGLDLLFKRDYKATRAHFKDVEHRYPGTGIKPAMDVVVWQALMLENFDYEYETQYWVSAKKARTELEAALESPGNQGFEHFLMAGMVGIEAIHTMRREKYLSALQLAFDAMEHAGKAAEIVPEFVDLKLADGMYNYWRTVVTMNNSMLPDFGDHREEGLAQMKEVVDGGIFVAAPARLAITFSYIEEHNLKFAKTELLRNSRAYPDNVINNMVLGQVFTYMRKYEEAMAAYERILAVAPENKRVHYWKGVTLMRSGKSGEAIPEFQTYLAFEYLEDYHRSYGHYRLGKCYYRDKLYAEAEEEYKKAVKLDGHKSAKKALDRMKKAKKEGRIEY